LNRRAVVAWTLYDFANSSFAAVVMGTIYAAYFAGLVVGNARGEGDLWWGRVVSVSMAIVAVTSPILGAVADLAGVRKALFMSFTLLSITATALMTTVEPGMIARGFLLGVVGNIGFEGALVYYNAWLPELAPPDRQGRLSGWGFAVGYAGSIVALLVALPFVKAGAVRAAFAPTAVLFAVFALPAFLWLPPAPAGRVPLPVAARQGLAEAAASLRVVLGDVRLRRFFGAYFFYEDAVNTVIAFSAIFAAQTLVFSLERLITLYVVVQISALIGALLWARPTDSLGPKPVVMITLVQWTLVSVAAWLVQTQEQFFVLAVVAGAGLGAVQSASRALLARLVPPGMEARMFGFYSLCGKSAAILGPLVFGGVSYLAGGNQRLGILAIGVLFVVGLALLSRVPIRPGPVPASASR